MGLPPTKRAAVAAAAREWPRVVAGAAQPAAVGLLGSMLHMCRNAEGANVANPHPDPNPLPEP